MAPTRIPSLPPRRRGARYSQLVCDRHQAAALHGTFPIDFWPYYSGAREFPELFANCDACYTAISSHCRAGGYPALFARRQISRIKLNAYHEGGHTEVAQALGACVTKVEITRTRDGRPLPTSGGKTHVHDIRNLPPEIAVPIYWAGRQTTLRWLAEHTTNTYADQVDACFGAVSDFAAARRNIRRHLGHRRYVETLERGRRVADKLIAQRWSTIVDIAAELERNGIITF